MLFLLPLLAAQGSGTRNQTLVAETMGRYAEAYAPQFVVALGDNLYEYGVQVRRTATTRTTTTPSFPSLYIHPRIASHRIAPTYAVDDGPTVGGALLRRVHGRGPGLGALVRHPRQPRSLRVGPAVCVCAVLLLPLPGLPRLSSRQSPLPPYVWLWFLKRPRRLPCVCARRSGHPEAEIDYYQDRMDPDGVSGLGSFFLVFLIKRMGRLLREPNRSPASVCSSARTRISRTPTYTCTCTGSGG